MASFGVSHEPPTHKTLGSAKVLGSGCQADAAGRAEANIGVRAVQGFEHGFAANDFGREEFEGVDAVFQSQLDFARSGNARNQGNAAVVAGFGEGFVQTRADGRKPHLRLRWL